MECFGSVWGLFGICSGRVGAIFEGCLGGVWGLFGRRLDSWEVFVEMFGWLDRDPTCWSIFLNSKRLQDFRLTLFEGGRAAGGDIRPSFQIPGRTLEAVSG